MINTGILLHNAAPIGLALGCDTGADQAVPSTTSATISFKVKLDLQESAADRQGFSVEWCLFRRTGIFDIDRQKQNARETSEMTCAIR